jgi:GNAT superfamily N-acetyltransferase
MKVEAGFTIREATPADVPTIASQRRGMFEDMGFIEAALMDEVEKSSAAWTGTRMSSGEYRAWLAVDRDGRAVAGAGLWLQVICSSPVNLPGRVGCVMNVYTAPEFRRQGLARRLMETVLDWCRRNGYPVVLLHASDFGRPLYESMGFKPTKEMRLVLEQS